MGEGSRNLRHIRGYGSILLVLAAILPSRGASADSERLSVQAQIRPSICYVGQGVELTVGVVAEDRRPEVATPQLAWADVVRLPDGPLRPLSVSAIGALTTQRNLFRSRFRLVPRKAGTFTLPPITARLDGRAGVSAPIALTAKAPPGPGKPADFLGGIGAFEVEARAEPSSLRLGQSFEYRVAIRGPGAWGVKAEPRVDRLARVPLGLEVERLPDESSDEPPTHTFRYRVRPTKPGEATLPPVAVAAFDPKAGVYMTRATAGVPVRVVDVPAFDARALDYGPRPATKEGDSWRPIVLAAALVLVFPAIAIAHRVWRRRARIGLEARWAAPSRRKLEEARDDVERAGAIAGALVEFLALTVDRPRGALTPPEAERGVLRATGSGALAGRARELADACDRVLFGDAPRRGDALRCDGLRLLEDLAGAAGSKTR